MYKRQEWERIDTALVNIGDYPSSPDFASLVRYGGLLQEHHACGRMLVYYFNEDGTVIQSDQDFAIDVYKRQPEGVLPAGAVLTNATGAYGLAVSEHMLALTFDLIRRLGQYHKNQADRQWRSMGNIISVEGSTILILGLGDIGGDYARKVKALGAYTIGVRRTCREKPEYLDEQYTMDDLDRLLPRADVVAMVVPGGPAPCHLMDERRLRLMKKGAYLINVGRGNAIDPAALKAVLKDGHLGGCGLDVTEPEPLPPEDELWAMDNVVITPHVAGNFFLAETFEPVSYTHLA